MFIGHFAASVAAKALRPSLPFWACVAASQLLDIGWASLVIAGVEHLRVVPTLPGSPLDLYDMPWTHSLAAAALWSVLAGWLASRLWGKAGWLIGAVVFSHWLADLLVHRPDLLLWPGGDIKLGLGLWNLPALAMLLEAGLLGMAVAWWTARRAGNGRPARPALGWFLALLVLGMINLLPGEPLAPTGMAGLALLGFALATGVGWLVDRADRQS